MVILTPPDSEDDLTTTFPPGTMILGCESPGNEPSLKHSSILHYKAAFPGRKWQVEPKVHMAPRNPALLSTPFKS